MTEPDPLSPAEALFLLKPNTTMGGATVRVTLFWLIAKGILVIEMIDTPGVLGTKKVPHPRVKTEGSVDTPPHAVALIDIARTAQAAGKTLLEMLKAIDKEFKSACVFFNTRFIQPPLVARGLIEKRRFLLVTFYWAITPAGEEMRRRILSEIEKAEAIPSLLKTDKTRAAAATLELGDTLLLWDKLHKHYEELGAAIDALGIATGLSDPRNKLGIFDARAFKAIDDAYRANEPPQN